MRLGKAVLLLAVATLSGSPGPGSAEEPPHSRTIEEVIVTAQKREQAVEDVPISMSVLTEDFIARQSITDLRDVSLFAANVQIQEAGYLIRPRIRGFSVNMDNAGFEPPVGLVLDGVPYTRLPYFQGALFDVSRVEVMRGPQGTTFGKNTTAGLLSIVTKDPTDELSGFVDLQLGELDRRRIETGIGGPLVAGLVNFRLAGVLDERDGFIENTTARIQPGLARVFRGRDRRGLRAKLQFLNLLGSELKLAFERSEVDSAGIGGELHDVAPQTQDFIRTYDPAADFDGDNFVTSLDAPDFRTTTISTFVGHWSYDLAGWGIEAIGGHSILDSSSKTDPDFSPVPSLIAEISEHSPTSTFEIRGVSPPLAGLLGLESLFGWALGSTDLLAGVFWQKRGIAPHDSFIVINGAPFTAMLATEEGDAATGPPAFGIPVPSPGEGLPRDVVGREELLIVFDQDSSTIAGFAQMDWHLLERWTLQYGMRLSHETKKGHWLNEFQTPDRTVFTVGQYQEFVATLKRSKTEIQPKVSLQYEPFEDLNLFASWARGFKGGGFNSIARGSGEEELSFEDESVSQWAIDAKAKLFGGLARLNVSLFRMDLQDFQILAVEEDGPANIFEVTKVLNAAEARAQGVEIDGSWLPFEWLTVQGSLGYNDTEFLDFKIAPCAPGRANHDGDEDVRCDISGRPFPFAPQWNAGVATDVRIPVATIPALRDSPMLGGLGFTAGLSIQYEDVQYLHASVDSRMIQKPYARLNASIGFDDPVRGWSAKIAVENLTDEAVAAERSTTNGVRHAFVTVLNPPRLVFGQIRWDF